MDWPIRKTLSGQRGHRLTTDIGIEDLHGMRGRHLVAHSVEARTDLQETSHIAGHQELGAGFQDA